MDNFEQPIFDSMSYNYEFLIFIFFVLIIGAIRWKLTHLTKERRYLSSEIKRRILKDHNYKYVKSSVIMNVVSPSPKSLIKIFWYCIFLFFYTGIESICTHTSDFIFWFTLLSFGFRYGALFFGRCITVSQSFCVFVYWRTILLIWNEALSHTSTSLFQPLFFITYLRFSRWCIVFVEFILS